MPNATKHPEIPLIQPRRGNLRVAVGDAKQTHGTANNNMIPSPVGAPFLSLLVSSLSDLRETGTLVTRNTLLCFVIASIAKQSMC